MNPFGHVRRRLLSGVLVLVPLVVTVAVLRFVFDLLAGVLAPLAGALLTGVPPFVVSLLSFSVLVLLVYFVGLLATGAAGRRGIALAEGVVTRIPVVAPIYDSVKHVVAALSSRGAGEFSSVVFLELPFEGCRAVGLVAGRHTDEGGEEFLKIFIPTSPNPTTGFLCLVPPARVRPSAMSVEEALRFVISAGLLSPDSEIAPSDVREPGLLAE